MLQLSERLKAFAKLGDEISKLLVQDAKQEEENNMQSGVTSLETLIAGATAYNGWFTEEHVRYMLQAIAESLKHDQLVRWLETYQEKIQQVKDQRRVAVIMAGNIPLVGFHDFLSVLISGNQIIAKLSADDNKLLPALAGLLVGIEPQFDKMIEFSGGTLKPFDAIIATGSNNTSRYFDYYFGKYPHLIRKNRNGLAVLTGDESEADLQGLADDIFLYYGLGCRNISKLLVPAGYDFTMLIGILAQRKSVIENHKYFNNYEYNKAIFLVNATQHFDSGNLLLTENSAITSPVSVVYYEFYAGEKQMLKYLADEKKNIQCVVSNHKSIKIRVEFGKSQQPALWDYADGVDTMAFLLSPEKGKIKSYPDTA